MEAGPLALIISVVATPIYTIVLALIFYRCLKENPFKPVNQKREEIKPKEEVKKEPPSKGDQMDFAEAKEIKPIAVIEQSQKKEEELKELDEELEAYEEEERKDSS